MPKKIELTAKEIRAINDHLEKNSGIHEKFKGLKVGKHIDTGGQAMVYTLIDKNGGEDYVIKILLDRSDDTLSTRLIKIKSASDDLAKRNCSNICKVEQAFTTYEPVTTYCYIEKRRVCLSDYISNYIEKNSKDAFNKIAPQIAIRVAVDLLKILMECERKYKDNDVIIIRDIKVGNLFLASQKISDGIFLGDFGSLTHRDEKMCLTSVNVHGTGPYKSPELYAMEASLANRNLKVPTELNDISKSDMYSLGVTLFYILSNGHYPFATTEDRFVLDNKDSYPRAKFGSEKLKDIIDKALRYKPSERFKSCADMYSQLIDTPEFKQYINPFVIEAKTDVYKPQHADHSDQKVVTKETVSKTIKEKLDNLDTSFQAQKKSTPTTTKPKACSQINFDNGDIYVGDVLNGKMHGKGIYTWSSGNIYKGDFVNGKMTGFGKLIYSDKTIYEGCIVNDLWEGMIKITYPDSDVFEAVYKNGELQGAMKPINSNPTSSTKRENQTNTIIQTEPMSDTPDDFVYSPSPAKPKKIFTVVNYIMWIVWIALAIAGLIVSKLEIGIMLIDIASIALLFLGQKLIHKDHKRWAWLPIIVGGTFLSVWFMMFTDGTLGAILFLVLPPIFYFSCWK